MRQRLTFALFIVAPFVLVFFVPLAFYRVPLHVTLYNRAVEAPGYIVSQAVAVALVWIAVVVACFLWPHHKAAATAWTWAPRFLWPAFLIFSIGGSVVSVAHELYRMPLGLEEVIHLAAFAPTLGFVLGLALWHAIPSGRARIVIPTVLFLDLVTALLVPILLSKMTFAVLSMIAIAYGVSVVRIPVHRKIFLGVVLAGLLVLVLLAAFPLKALLRETVYYGPFDRPRVGGRVVLSPNTIPQTIFNAKAYADKFPPDVDLWKYGLRFHRVGRLSGFWQYAIWRALVRTDRISDLAYVVEMTPSTVPYTGGSTYAPLAYKLIPRVLWPWRPAEDAGAFYAHRYDLDAPTATNASYNLPMVTEGWVNGGWLAVMLSAAFVGLLLRVLWWYGIGNSGAIGNVLVGMAVVGTAADIESNLSLVMGGVIHAFVFYGAVAFAVHAWSDRLQGRSSLQGMPIGSS